MKANYRIYQNQLCWSREILPDACIAAMCAVCAHSRRGHLDTASQAYATADALCLRPFGHSWSGHKMRCSIIGNAITVWENKRIRGERIVQRQLDFICVAQRGSQLA
eukprot:6189308-Pleurochrysis_carterae.AAC.1